METFDLLMQGFSTAATPMNLLYAFIGVLLGTAVGVLPGIGPAMAVALLLPVTYSLEPTSAFIMFAGIYYGGMYGGSTTSILLNTPGESSTVITAIEGHKMAKSGRAAQALATDPKVLLCDEPLLSLDLHHQQAVSALINAQCHEQNSAVVFVTHEINPIIEAEATSWRSRDMRFGITLIAAISAARRG